ncbi:alkaline phosphatase family protein [Fulvivirga sp. 29W222]|uniref:Alkaline phosphatase family protein n=1 Tax=Fulvivirga marina TaxID=2494733 RepID=A0A937FZ07_9BACT|nr:alkaline phosphatase PafA [Fulvivirga marina]MBL6447081.1 alkaline phosphatase family protein [Fulvivirga marina]
MKKLLLLVLFINLAVIAESQAQKPKLVVGVIVDQMRQEYLVRFQPRFGEEGFNRMMREGYVLKNAHFNYVPTYTAPGHASVYTGSTPGVHGIIGNNWYNKELKRMVYCTDDERESTVGSLSSKGEMSPHYLLSTTITDELRLFTKRRSKVVGVSIKDRGAIFPAGHLGQAYWYDKETGDFITSTYYREKLPPWVSQFNSKKRANYYLSKTWEPLYDINTYTASDSDRSKYEMPVGDREAVFPYDLSQNKEDYESLATTPFGNDILAELAMAAIEGEELGRGDDTDFLAVSFSSTDYIGHHFGPNSIELEDTYLRLDKNLAELISMLDRKVGKGNYVLFLTADHAVAEVPQYLIDNKVPAGYFTENIKEKVREALTSKYGEGDWVENFSNLQVFFNRKLMLERKVPLHEAQEFVADYIMQFDGIAESYPAYVINWMDYGTQGIKGLLARGYHQKRSGDVLFSLQPGWFIGWDKTGTTHHSAFTYDTHVPMLWYGAGVKKGESYQYHPVTDIAPTLSMMLGIKLPSAATGQPILELLQK